MEKSFDIISYMGSLTGYSLESSVLERIALERGVSDVKDYSDLTEKDRDLLLADIIFTVCFLFPTQTPSISKKHGTFSQTIGAQTITYKDRLYDMMLRLYKKWDDAKLGEIEGMNDGLQWIDESDS